MKHIAARRVVLASGLAVCFASLAVNAQGNDVQRPAGFPKKPIRVIVGSSPGGGVDLITRSVMQRLSERWGAAVVIDNRTGAGGAIAVELLARAAPDGYTLYGGGSQVVTATPLKKVPFDTRKVLDPVAHMTSSWYLLVVPPLLPVSSVRELIEYTKKRPSSYGSAGMGSGTHLGTELFKYLAGANMVHVPYKGNGQAMNDLMAGQIQMLFTSTISGAPHVKSGRLKAIAVSSPKRLPAFPDLPTISESGVPNFEMDNFYGIYAPHGVPSAILLALNNEIVAIMNSPQISRAVAADGAAVAPPLAPAEFKAKFARQLEMWEDFIRKTNLKIE